MSSSLARPGGVVMSVLRHPSAARMTALGMTFAFSLVVARVLGPHHAGVIFASVVGASGIGMVARYGSEFAVLRHGSALHAGQNLNRAALDWPRLLRLCAVNSVAACVVVLLALLAVQEGSNRTVYAIFALSIPFQSVAVLCSALLRAGGDAGRGAFAEVGLTQGGAAAVTVLLGVTGNADTVNVAIAFTVCCALVCAWSLLVARRVWQPERARQGDAPGIRRVARVPLSSLGAMMSSSVLFYALTWTPMAVLVMTSTQTQVAWFGAAARFPTLIALIPTVQMTAGLPAIAARFAGGDLAGANDEIQRIDRRAAALAVTAGGALMLGGQLVMAVFGPGFVGAAPTLAVLVAGQVVAVLLGPASLLPLVTGYERHAMVALCVALPVAIVAETLLAAPWGALGAAIGWSVTVAGFGLAMAVVLRRGAGVISYVSLGRQPAEVDEMRAV